MEFIYRCCMKNLTIFKFEPTTPSMSQNIAAGWPNARNILHPTMLRYVVLKMMLRSFGQGLAFRGLKLCGTFNYAEKRNFLLSWIKIGLIKQWLGNKTSSLKLTYTPSNYSTLRNNHINYTTTNVMKISKPSCYFFPTSEAGIDIVRFPGFFSINSYRKT